MANDISGNFMESTLDIPHTHLLCTAGQARQLDDQTINNFGIDGYTLMEIAGSKAADHLLDQIEPNSHGLYICGKGNNCGDALVVARYLSQYGHKATLVFISGTDGLSPDADSNYKLLQKLDNQPGQGFFNIIDSWESFSGDGSFDFVVDGMLGTGLDSDLRGDYIPATEWINNTGLPVYAIDIPTGLHADSGTIMGTAVAADITYTFGCQKVGFYLNDGPALTGEVVFCDLPFPNYLKSTFNLGLISEDWVEIPHYRNREKSRHKYEGGILYLIAGSEGLTGAAMMAAKSAWATGIGAVMVICPRGIVPVFETELLQQIKKPVGSRSDYYFKPEHLDDILDILQDKPGKVLLGPGIGRTDETKTFVHQLLQVYSGDIVIDADALWALSQLDDWGPTKDVNWILTPHPGELSQLFDISASDDHQRLYGVAEASVNHSIHIVSKGYPGIVASPDDFAYLTGYDTRMFSRAGFGDILAGKIGAYWALQYSAEKSSLYSLLDGYNKAQQVITNNNRAPEPLDLI